MLTPISLSTWCFMTQTGGPTLAQTVELIVSAGYGVEFSGYQHQAPDALARRRWSEWKALTAGAPTISVHWKNERDALDGELDFLAYVGGDALVIHPDAIWREDDHTAPDEALLGDLVKRAADAGLYIALENLLPEDVPLMQRCLERYGPVDAAGGFGICLDVGHAVMPQPRAHGHLQEMLEKFGPAIVNVHLHEVCAANGDHHLPGIESGLTDWPGFARSLRDQDVKATGTVELWLPETNGPPAAFLVDLQEAIRYWQSLRILA